MRKEWLHTKPFIVAGVFLLAGIVMIAVCAARRDDPDMNGYAFGAFGLMFIIAAGVTFAVYGSLEKRYRHLLRDGLLLRYILPEESHRAQIGKNIAELRMKNKALLMVMLFFCVLFAIILPFFVEEKLLMAGICLGLGVFLSLAALVITSYRVRKLQRGGEEVILGRGGAYIEGSFHAWDMPGTAITGLDYQPPAGHGMASELKIEYTTEAHPSPLTETIILLIPQELDDEMPRVLEALESTRG